MNLIHIGQQIREQRKRLNFTQAEAALRAGISRATFNALENGQLPELGVVRLTRVLSTLGLSISVGPMQLRRPTLEDRYAQQAADAIARGVRSTVRPGR